MKAVTELDGQWAMTRILTAGEEFFDAGLHDETLPLPRLHVQGNQARVEGIRVLFVRDFSFALDPTASPKQIDATFLEGSMKGKTFGGIYALRGDELRICLRLQQTDLGRPKGFSTVSGTSLYTFILTRVRKPGDRLPATSLRPLPPVSALAPAPEAPALKFDAVLQSGKRLYFVLDRPKGDGFQAELAAFGRHAELALRIAERGSHKELTVVFFMRVDPKGPVGFFTGLSRERLREIAAVPVEKRTGKLLEHAWANGRLPKDARPVPVEHLADVNDIPLPRQSPTPAE
ncbi:hypothetical protein FRUB_05826 [Fimbriiglobus ruber]|uniref:Uncharacterized protein n=1 Tax=Fimbriiglobus ruber TaxID=1908690 RepID=A0A225DQW6_9BACT|nr:hypothetical protein FRUB_05826 [Fimbriiglobus ruber]